MAESIRISTPSLVTLLLINALVILPLGCRDHNLPEQNPRQLVNENGCNPLASEGDCLLPYPSDVYLVDDGAMPSGKRIHIFGDAVPRTLANKELYPLRFYKADGFSLHAQIAVLFPEGVDDSNLVFHTDDVAASLGENSPTVILEAATAKRVPHFAELDPNAHSDERRTLLIRPLVRLKEKTRYIVAIRHLKNKNGELVSAPAGFQKILDGETSDSEILSLLADAYEEKIFPALDSANISRDDDLQLAWDFTTSSEENANRDMLTIRDDSIKQFETNPPAVWVTEVWEDVGSNGSKLVKGSFKVPLYLESDSVGAMLNRDEKGNVLPSGEADVPWSAIIPPSVLGREEGAAPARAIQYGHSAFSSQNELMDRMILPAADILQSVFFCVDWWGFTIGDASHISATLFNSPSDVFNFGDRIHQAMVNQIGLTYAITETMVNLAELLVGDALAYDPAHVYFYGNSGGAILGATYTALAPKIERSVLGVGGASFALLMYRSLAFDSFFDGLNLITQDPVEVQKAPLVYQTVIDRIDPTTYAPHMIHDLFPGSPASRNVLLQIGIGDARVCTLSGELLARISGLKLLEPAPYPVYGLESQTAPYEGSAMVVFDFNLDPLPGTKAEIPSADNPVHNGIRVLPEANAQIDAFFRPDGKIEATCEGTCDPN